MSVYVYASISIPTVPVSMYLYVYLYLYLYLYPNPSHLDDTRKHKNTDNGLDAIMDDDAHRCSADILRKKGGRMQNKHQELHQKAQVCPQAFHVGVFQRRQAWRTLSNVSAVYSVNIL